MVEKTQVNIKIDPKVYDEFRKKCIDSKREYSEVAEILMEKFISGEVLIDGADN